MKGFVNDARDGVPWGRAIALKVDELVDNTEYPVRMDKSSVIREELNQPVDKTKTPACEDKPLSITAKELKIDMIVDFEVVPNKFKNGPCDVVLSYVKPIYGCIFHTEHDKPIVQTRDGAKKTFAIHPDWRKRDEAISGFKDGVEWLPDYARVLFTPLIRDDGGKQAWIHHRLPRARIDDSLPTHAIRIGEVTRIDGDDYKIKELEYGCRRGSGPEIPVYNSAKARRGGLNVHEFVEYKVHSTKSGEATISLRF